MLKANKKAVSAVRNRNRKTLTGAKARCGRAFEYIINFFWMMTGMDIGLFLLSGHPWHAVVVYIIKSIIIEIGIDLVIGKVPE